MEHPKRTITALLLLCGGVAIAAEPAMKNKPQRPVPQQPRSLIKMMDTNGDGVVDEKEFVAASVERAKAAFKQFDLNRDGKYTLEEEQEMLKRRGQMMRMRSAQRPNGPGMQRGQQGRPPQFRLSPQPSPRPPAAPATPTPQSGK